MCCCQKPRVRSIPCCVWWCAAQTIFMENNASIINKFNIGRQDGEWSNASDINQRGRGKGPGSSQHLAVFNSFAVSISIAFFKWSPLMRRHLSNHLMGEVKVIFFLLLEVFIYRKLPFIAANTLSPFFLHSCANKKLSRNQLQTGIC